jgi:integrase/recombinase XerD
MKKIKDCKWLRNWKGKDPRYSSNSWRSLPRSIEPDDLIRLVKKRFTPQTKCMIFLLLRTGMRISELLTLRVQDIILRQRIIIIPEGSKTGLGRIAYISDDTLVTLKRWLKARNPKKKFFFYSSYCENMSYSTARSIFNDCMKKCFLKKKGYTLHCLRHTFASELLSVGLPIESLQVLMGHSDIEMTRWYARLTDIALKKDYFVAMQTIEEEGIHGTYRSYRTV